MYLVAAEAEHTAAGGRSNTEVHQRWDDFPVSYLGHHGADCCESARLWLRNMDFAQLNGTDRASGPRWIRKQYEWGPTSWPFHWCEALGSEAIDCGAHAALAQEAFEARGLTSHRVQLVQSYDPRAIAQWRSRWGWAHVSDQWLGEDFIYHEGNALLVGSNEIKLWDASAGCWLNPTQTSGYGSLLAMRLICEATDSEPRAFRWGQHQIVPNRWQSLGENAAL